MDVSEWLKRRWINSGLKPGDTLLLHSNIKRTLFLMRKHSFEPSPYIILESFLDILGDNGTLLLPTFNFDFTRGIAFDIRNTKSKMGILTEIGRKHKNAIRTAHPIFSFAVIGKLSNLFCDLDNLNAFGTGSPFDILTKINGKIGVLDLHENDSVTFHHHVEQMMNVKYRYNKNFTGYYIDINGNKSVKTYSFFVRNLELGVERNINVIGEKLISENIYCGDRPNTGSGLRIADAKKVFDYVKRTILSNKANPNLYIIKKN